MYVYIYIYAAHVFAVHTIVCYTYLKKLSEYHIAKICNIDK